MQGQNPRQSLGAIHHRHVHVEDHQVHPEAILQQAEGLLPARGAEGLVPQELQDLGDRLADEVVVVHQENAQ